MLHPDLPYGQRPSLPEIWQVLRAPPAQKGSPFWWQLASCDWSIHGDESCLLLLSQCRDPLVLRAPWDSLRLMWWLHVHRPATPFAWCHFFSLPFGSPWLPRLSSICFHFRVCFPRNPTWDNLCQNSLRNGLRKQPLRAPSWGKVEHDPLAHVHQCNC